MTYVALKNFRIAKLVVSVGDIYTGGDVDMLLQKGLIKLEEPSEPMAMDVPEVLEVPPPMEKKSKKKKE